MTEEMGERLAEREEGSTSERVNEQRNLRTSVCAGRMHT